MADLDCIIGSITRGFVRTEHLISVIGHHFEFYADRYGFFAQINTAIKLKTIKESFEKSAVANKEDYAALIERFDELRLKRNKMVHGIIHTDMHDSEHHIVHHYSTKKGEVRLKVGEFRTSELTAVKTGIIEVHNALHELFFLGDKISK